MQKKTRMTTNNFKEAISIRVCTKPACGSLQLRYARDQRVCGVGKHALLKRPELYPVPGKHRFPVEQAPELTLR